MSILTVENLRKVYSTRFGGNQVEALKNVNFSVDEGEYVAIMGESGSGKTTLLNLLAALDKPTGGTVVLDGKELGRIKESDVATFRRDNLGFVFQDFALWPHMTVFENAAFGLRAYAMHRERSIWICSPMRVRYDRLTGSRFRIPGCMSGSLCWCRSLKLNQTGGVLPAFPLQNLSSRSSVKIPLNTSAKFPNLWHTFFPPRVAEW